ncbi:hypothetical protein [Allokutzneria sp. NRRL B-24872]|uniref:hypothetical protein n=1 Tax=Allokutzneria sp. NRRL B-24872 TaxID=1137961 RepID=UPI001178757D|nr:hypothetical protein [Allokutzneria sp. NRRL B-24872]
MSAAVAALAASAAFFLPGQAGAASGELLQPKENLECGFTRSYVAESKGWGPNAYYKNCSTDGKNVILEIRNALKFGRACAPPHQPHQATQLPLIDGVYEVMQAVVVGTGCTPASG